MATIEIGNHGTTFAGREAVEVFRLASLISALGLEKKGLKLSRGVSALSIAKRTTGLRTNNRDEQIARIRVMLEEARAAVTVVQS